MSPEATHGALDDDDVYLLFFQKETEHNSMYLTKVLVATHCALLWCSYQGSSSNKETLSQPELIESRKDTRPVTTAPLSLVNLQVTVGCQNVLQSTLHMTYEHVLRWYFVNVERGNIADKLQPRNINVSFTNNSNVPIHLLIFNSIQINQ